MPGATGNVLIDKLLTTVIGLKASDLHISVGQPPVIRHQSRLRRLETKILDSDDTTALMKSITPDRCQQELQEKGGSDFAIEYADGTRFRVAVFKQRGNIGLVLRRIPNQFLSFEQIGMPDAIRMLITRPRGLLLVTGPTGSGKTTSLASMINFLNKLLAQAASGLVEIDTVVLQVLLHALQALGQVAIADFLVQLGEGDLPTQTAEFDATRFDS